MAPSSFSAPQSVTVRLKAVDSDLDSKVIKFTTCERDLSDVVFLLLPKASHHYVCHHTITLIQHIVYFVKDSSELTTEFYAILDTAINTKDRAHFLLNELKSAQPSSIYYPNYLHIILHFLANEYITVDESSFLFLYPLITHQMLSTDILYPQDLLPSSLSDKPLLDVIRADELALNQANVDDHVKIILQTLLVASQLLNCRGLSESALMLVVSYSIKNITTASVHRGKFETIIASLGLSISAIRKVVNQIESTAMHKTLSWKLRRDMVLQRDERRNSHTLLVISETKDTYK